MRTSVEDFIREHLSYDPETGVITWIKSPGSNITPGSEAGTIAKNGKLKRRIICIRKKLYKAHRIAWLLMTGDWPHELVDHIDGDGLNNRWCNLRAATVHENARNRRCFAKSLLKGAYFSPNRKRNPWHSAIYLNGKQTYLGCFETPEEAHAAYTAAAQKHFGEFACAT